MGAVAVEILYGKRVSKSAWLVVRVSQLTWTTMFVLFGLNETQSSPLFTTESWITIESER